VTGANASLTILRVGWPSGKAGNVFSCPRPCEDFVVERHDTRREHPHGTEDHSNKSTEMPSLTSVVDSPGRIQRAFAYCEDLTRNHYENFPVASRCVPRHLRPHLCSIYAFSRTADDFADEASLTPSERLHNLDEWGRKLDQCFEGHADDPVFIALAQTARRFGIPKKPFLDLLTAFRYDVTQTRFETFKDLQHYCEFSANPVGRLVLHLFV